MRVVGLLIALAIIVVVIVAAGLIARAVGRSIERRDYREKRRDERLADLEDWTARRSREDLERHRQRLEHSLDELYDEQGNPK